MGGWDWIHAGLEIATYAKAQKAQRNLTEMKTAGEIETARRALFDAMKNFIFNISRDIQLAEEQVTESPQQVYIVSKSLEWRLTNSGLTADMLPDTQDKEYFFKTERKVAEVVRISKEKLTPEQIQESETAVQYIAELPIIQQAILAKTAQEKLNEIEKKWQDLAAKNGNNQVFILLGAVAVCPSCVCLMSPIMGGGDSSGLSMFLGLVALVGAIALIAKGRSVNPEYAELKSKREILKKQLMPEDEWAEVTSVFGDVSSTEFKKFSDERLAFLAPLLGGGFQQHLINGNGE